MRKQPYRYECVNCGSVQLWSRPNGYYCSWCRETHRFKHDKKTGRNVS